MLLNIIAKINTFFKMTMYSLIIIIRHDKKISLLFDVSRLPDAMFPKPMQAQTLNL